MRYDIERFLMAIMPLLIAAFCILLISALCDIKWMQVLLEIPIWSALVWWMWIDSRERYL